MKVLALKLFFLILLCFTAGPGYGQGTIDLPRTGQDTCYDADGNVIPCSDTGQDGDLQAGIPWPVPRFEDNGDGTLTDNLTGLIWLKNADCYTALNFTTSLQACNELEDGQCGLEDASIAGDWRLPNVVELESLIVNEGRSDSANWLIEQGFTNVQSQYWSSTTFRGTRDEAWIVTMEGTVYKYDKRANVGIYHWPVRGGSD